MPIQQDPKTLYPNSVADHLVEYLRGEVDARVEHYGSELFFEEDGIHLYKGAMDGTAVFLNARSPRTLDDHRRDLVMQTWRGRARVTHHNPVDEVERYNEGLVYVQKCIAMLQGYKVPIDDVHGVEGGERYIDTADADELINTVSFMAYEFDFSLDVAHNLSSDRE